MTSSLYNAGIEYVRGYVEECRSHQGSEHLLLLHVPALSNMRRICTISGDTWFD
jgi:hypothetical protein